MLPLGGHTSPLKMAALPDINANIMLDLETASVNAKPCIIELSAVHFNLNTGQEYSHFSTPISLESCLAAGLHLDLSTVRWLNIHIPEILDRSENSLIQLSDALKDFAKWVHECHLLEKETRRKAGGEGKDVELILWGNGAFTDNKWIEAAFTAAKLQQLMPCAYYGHHCVRTFVKQVAWITGVDYARKVEMRGKKHVSLDDCRHQVRYLVLARRALRCVDTRDMPDPNGDLPCEVEEALVVEERAKKENEKKIIVAEKVVAEASKTSTEDKLDLQELAEKAERQVEKPRAMAQEGEKNTTPRFEDEAAALRMQNEAAEETEKGQLLPELKKDSGNRRGAAVRTGLGFGLITPESSFSDPPAYDDLTLTQDTVDQNLVSTQDTVRYKEVDINLVSTQDTERYKDMNENLTSTQDTVRGGYEDLTPTQETEVNKDFILVSSQDNEKDGNERKGEANRERDSSPKKRRCINEEVQRPALLSPEASFSK